MDNFFIKGICRTSRQEGVFQIREMVDRDGDIVGVNMFSDVSMSLRIEIELRKVDRLIADLAKLVRLDEFPPLNSNAEIECVIHLHIIFKDGTGDMKREIPDIPG